VAGDQLLSRVGRILCSIVRKVDLCARVGGDEFAVLMPETDGALADTVARRLNEGIKTAFPAAPVVSASIGIVSFDDTTATADDVLRRADQAMYEAKRSGKDQVVHSSL
jgi:diguanylate cyclase (GGDEF)-like protein